MGELLNNVMLAVVGLIVLPAIVAGGGFVVAGVLAAAVLVGVYGTKFGLDLLKQRHVGAKRAPDVRERVRGTGRRARETVDDATDRRE